MTTLATERLILRPPHRRDVEAILHGLGNFSVSRWTGRVPHPYAASDADAFIAHCGRLARRDLVLAITLRDELIGVIGIEQGELGYWLAEPQWGKGFGREAARAITDHAFEALDMEELAASHHVGNQASRRILLGLGFVQAGEGKGFSRARQEEVPLALLALTRQGWQQARERRR